MKYIAFLRGINISCKNKIAMADLKSELVNIGYSDVSTYLNSGNVSFTTENTSIPALRENIEEMIQNKFELDVPVYVMEYNHLQNIISNAPSWWGTSDESQYDNLIFILSEDKPDTIAEMVGPLSDGLEKMHIYDDIIYWSFDRKLYQKCNWWKRTASAGIAERLTIRTAKTLKKILK